MLSKIDYVITNSQKLVAKTLEVDPNIIADKIRANNNCSNNRLDERIIILNYCRLYANSDIDVVNRYLENFQFDPKLCYWGKVQDTEDWDFTAIELLRLYFDFQDSALLSDKAKEHIKDLFINWVQPRQRVNRENNRYAILPGYHTENHDIMLLTIGYFSQILSGKSGEAEKDELKKYLRWRMQLGRHEDNSNTYDLHFANPLFLLFDHAMHDDLKLAAEAELNHLLAQRVLLSLKGVVVGPQSRNKANPEQPYADNLIAIMYLFFDFNLYDKIADDFYFLGAALAKTKFRPHSYLVELAQNRDNMPPFVYTGMRTRQDGEYNAYKYYITPNIAMGSADFRGFTDDMKYNSIIMQGENLITIRTRYIADINKKQQQVYGINESIQYKNVLLTRGEFVTSGAVKELQVGSWRCFYTEKAIVATYSLKEDWVIIIADDLKGVDPQSYCQQLITPEEQENLVFITLSNQEKIIFERTNGRYHKIFLSSYEPANCLPRLDGNLHKSPYLNSCYASGEIEIAVASLCQLTTNIKKSQLFHKF